MTRPPDRDGEPDAPETVRSDATDELWAEVGIDPIKIALPNGTVGYTLRAYRPASQLTPTELPAGQDAEADLFAERERTRAAEDADLGGLDDLVVEDADEAVHTDQQTDQEPDPAHFPDDGGGESEEAEPDEPTDEEVPVFLSHRGQLLLFASPESLVAFVGSDAPHDLTQLDTWATVSKRARAEDIVPADGDTYELDLVVENLRGGHDAWDLHLLIAAGELARDLGWALRLEPVITSLSAGSPLDDLDEILRSTAAGGIGGFVSRRRLRRIGAQQASLGWRTIIGKISGAVDWRD